MIDAFLLGLVAVFVVLGILRGVVSQVASMVAMVGVFLFSTTASAPIMTLLQKHLGTSASVASPLSLFLSATLIYSMIRLVGFFLEKVFVNHMAELKMANRVGGGFLGMLKAFGLIFITLFFVNLVPEKTLAEWAPKLFESKMYQIASKHNPLGKKDLLDRMTTVWNENKKQLQISDRKKDLEQLIQTSTSSAGKKTSPLSTSRPQVSEAKKREKAESNMNEDALVKFLTEKSQVN
ncbi:MAG: CvpA family protein [Bdellovibrionota bacterium]